MENLEKKIQTEENMGIPRSVYSYKDLALSFLIPGYAIKKWRDVRKAGYDVSISQDLIIEVTKAYYYLPLIQYLS